MTKRSYESLPPDVRKLVDTAVAAMRLIGPSHHAAFVRQAVLDAGNALPICWTNEARCEVMESVGGLVRERYRVLQATEVEPADAADASPAGRADAPRKSVSNPH